MSAEEVEGLVIYNVLPLCDFWECQGSLEVSSGGSGGPDVGDWSSGGAQWCQVSENQADVKLTSEQRQTYIISGRLVVEGVSVSA